MINVLAVYENGVLRPTTPLALREGQTVEVAVTETRAKPPMTIQEWEAKMHAAKTFQEWAALVEACPEPDLDFDLAKAINESRKATGFRVVDPAYQDEEGAR